jgi:hypothetical protein
MTEWNVAKSAEVLGVACSFCLCVIAFFVNYFNTKNIVAWQSKSQDTESKGLVLQYGMREYSCCAVQNKW